jgi:hypothetical protein
VVLISLEFFSLLPTFDIFSVLDDRVVFDTDLQALFDIDFELQNVPPANVPSNPVQSVQSMPVQFNSLMEASCNNVAPVTNLCLGRATTRSHSSQWSKKKVAGQKENLHLWYWYRLNFFHYFTHLTYSQCWMAELSLRTFDHRDLSVSFE